MVRIDLLLQFLQSSNRFLWRIVDLLLVDLLDTSLHNFKFLLHAIVVGKLCVRHPRVLGTIKAENRPLEILTRQETFVYGFFRWIRLDDSH
jgi:hypothetical protein